MQMLILIIISVLCITNALVLPPKTRFSTTLLQAEKKQAEKAVKAEKKPYTFMEVLSG